MDDLPYSQACENNKSVILEKLTTVFATSNCVLEIGSGTGQHAVFFANALSHLTWVPSDRVENHQSIKAWIKHMPSPNLRPPLVMSFPEATWPAEPIDAVFTANTAHIMQENEVRAMMQLIEDALPAGGHFCQYGPFTDKGVFSSQSNQEFHLSLVARGYGGYRDIQELANWSPSLQLLDVHEMPANNLLLHWQKTS
ncbi:MAG: DUF938 domain-containing protein [Pseudomonadota bacterium]